MTDDAPVLLVTGGSRGIGAAVCLAAAQHGWAVAVNYASNKDAAEAVVGTIVDAGGQATAVAGDVGKPEDIKAIFAKVDAHFGRIDGLVNNAGIVDVIQRLDEMTPERIDRMFRINVTGSMLAAAEAVRRMSTRHGGKGGVIVNVSSMAATLGGGGQYVDYAASKGAIDTFTVGLAREVAAEGIRVNAVRPGIIDTDIHAAAGLPDRARDIAPQLPMKRSGTADEVADAILYLLSPHASYITGAVLDVSGGR
ncbi:NAD(P)-dependent dehydrogenase (short-subunit alcohol dehydrogenase family) [Rhizobium sp. ERR 1071]|uniref:Glucose-1-dehydrogenase n=1 Tax=Rhizobium dioscoreae TaxID=2653122 RepID=A0ABQ0ZCT0_9HYPH|nr:MULTISPECIES: SDR family oxidoreductase [Rhizobium]TWB10687.1 NAD(P)-dependent dehydrogenase (short-subunit alcohol dehydrogenase family) [Rhizobium sp. ERR1071]GES53313.1 glucose-1-dehydrogenase [Rhizobium dioscoreae]GLU84719.1 glucose-1-dehydrogenase [Rhizobium sp. NBRC 114257]